MGKVDPNAYGRGDGERKPTLTPDVLKNARVAVLTVADVRMGIPAGGRTTGFLEFAEKPGYNLWLNKSGVVALVDSLGDDSDKWRGKRVPIILAHTNNPTTGKPVTVYHVAPADEWDDIMAEHGRRRSGVKAKAAKKKARK